MFSKPQKHSTPPSRQNKTARVLDDLIPSFRKNHEANGEQIVQTANVRADALAIGKCSTAIKGAAEHINDVTQ